MKRAIVAAAFAVMALPALWGQNRSAPLTFEVASIKPSAPDYHGTTFEIQPGGGLRVTGVTLKMLLEYMFDVRDFQISGGPGWISSDRYDMVAKPERTSGPEIDSGDLRKLRYAVVVSKTGSKLQPAEGGGRDQMRMGRGEILAEAAQMQMLTHALANVLGRPVIDKTGLTGKFDFKPEWTPDPGQGGGNFGPPPPGVDAPPPVATDGPSIFTAVQEQLGLRLESEKGPAETIVIDRVEKPSEN